MVSSDPFLSHATPAVFVFRKKYGTLAKIKDMSALIYTGAKFRENIDITMEENTFIGTNAVILVPKLTMRKGSQINAGAILSGKDEIMLEENVVVGYGCVLLTSTDTSKGKFMNDAIPEEKRKIRRGPIIVRKNSFIGANVVVMPNLEVGPNAILGAGCYVDKPVLPNRKLIPIAGLYVDLPRQRKPYK